MFPKTRHLNGSLIPLFFCIFCGVLVIAENDSGKNVAILMANNKLMKRKEYCPFGIVLSIVAIE